MLHSHDQPADDVEQILLNARLRDELEPYCDESISRLNVDELPTSLENEYLASMLAWERAPALPISQWFQPELVLPPPELLDDAQLRDLLWQTVHRLYGQRIVLDFTDHLSDRQLYTLIYRDILPCYEKRIEGSPAWLHWDCADTAGNAEDWLRYYASDEERVEWARHCDEPLPPKEPLPYPRNLPRRPL
jgi:hypothetical protein